jgi:predicted HicB family RNase H-like nuclease
MGSIYVRDMDETLVRRIKAQAALSGQSLREYVIEVLEKDLKERIKSARGKPRKQ